MAISSPWSREVAQHLSARGLVVTVIDLQPKGTPGSYIDFGKHRHGAQIRRFESEVGKVYRVTTPKLLPLRLGQAALAIRRIARERELDVILTLYGGSLAAAAYLSGVRPYLVYVVGSDVLLTKAIENRVARLTLGNAAAVIANGKHLANTTKRLAAPATVVPLYLGVNVDDYAARPGERLRFSFICTRGFLRVYDNATIIRALALLKTIPSDMTVSFLSSGPLLTNVEGLADRLIEPSWRSKVVFLNGVSDSQLKVVIRSGSFYLSASLSDGTSSSLLEAMAAGAIPIVTDIPANREWIEPGKNGLLFRPGDHEGLADAIRRALLGEPWMEAARETNQSLVRERADSNVTMSALSAILESHREKPGLRRPSSTARVTCLL